ncbi:MAG TPA: nicotinate (nicotinamide) nucleotide adenylyltransferase [Bacteroidales bacterium]|nr:nicotinate (nicotinamide) nucleotide adenylyltransferase [Bacteroidales bacterium]HPT02521.1 nicotinate (nicotinamide) nucleotide adenylyltransferase [Bacteroidales bacterium]
MQELKKTGLFFGSFNPVHLGHMMIANYMYEYSDLEELWFVVSPHNPLKERASLLPDHHRLEMVNLAIGDDERFRSCDIEFKLEKPSYTIDTLTYLQEKYPSREFILISGTDIFPTFHKWKNWETLLDFYKLYVYPRPGTQDHELTRHGSVKMFDAPMVEISSSFIRQAIKEGRNVSHFVPEKVWRYLVEMHFYEG